jgi:hypothetical protein
VAAKKYEKPVIAMLLLLLHSATLAMAVGPFAHWFAVRA